MSTVTKKVVLITGANSGIGFQASLRIAQQADYHVILTGRNGERVHEAAEKVRATAAPSTTVEEAVLDIGDLAAVRYYAVQLKQRQDVPVIAAILCNAGVNLVDKSSTKDGLETTFAVNYLGHFLLATLLREQTQRFVIISSETHDPAENTQAPLPNVSDLDQLAVGYEPFIGGEAYSTSKLCNLLFMSEWLRRFPNGPEFIAYTPGFTPDTAMLRHHDTSRIPMVVEMCKKFGVPVNSSEAAGAFMARLVVEDWAGNGWKSGDYLRVDQVYHTSTQAQDEMLAHALWDKSEELIKRVVAY